MRYLVASPDDIQAYFIYAMHDIYRWVSELYNLSQDLYKQYMFTFVIPETDLSYTHLILYRNDPYGNGIKHYLIAAVNLVGIISLANGKDYVIPAFDFLSLCPSARLSVCLFVDLSATLWKMYGGFSWNWLHISNNRNSYVDVLDPGYCL